MNRRSLAGLVVLNVALVVVLGILCLTPSPAQAQLGDGRGDYLMVAGQIQGRTTQAVYILDISSGRMIAVTFDRNRRGFLTLGARDVNSDTRTGGK